MEPVENLLNKKMSLRPVVDTMIINKCKLRFARIQLG
jgi:hypothetical protein